MLQIKEATDYTKQEWLEMGYEKANLILEPLNSVKRLEALQNTPQSHHPYEEWIRRSKSEIMHKYMNAKKTYWGAGGHGKAERNLAAAKYYIDVMNKYNIPIPPDNIATIIGSFNGEGAV